MKYLLFVCLLLLVACEKKDNTEGCLKCKINSQIQQPYEKDTVICDPEIVNGNKPIPEVHDPWGNDANIFCKKN